MNTHNALKELKSRVANPLVDEEHRLEIIMFLKKVIVDDKYFIDFEQFFKDKIFNVRIGKRISNLSLVLV